MWVKKLRLAALIFAVSVSVLALFGSGTSDRVRAEEGARAPNSSQLVFLPGCLQPEQLGQCIGHHLMI